MNIYIYIYVPVDGMGYPHSLSNLGSTTRNIWQFEVPRNILVVSSTLLNRDL